MHVLPLGPFMLNFELVIFIVSSLIAYLAVKYRLSKAGEDGRISDKFVTALIIGFLVWKFSLIVFDFNSVIQYPMSLLYFNGGDKGLGLAFVIVLLFLWRSYRVEGSSLWINLDVLITGVFAGSGAYHLLLLTMDRTSMWFHVLYSGIAIILLLFLYNNKKTVGNRVVLNQLAIMVVAILVVGGIYDSISNQINKSSQQKVMAEANIGLKIGNKAPDFELSDLNNQSIKLSEYAGKKVILNFWATWCPPCKVEMPHIQEFHENYGEDVVVLAVNLTHTEKSEDVVRDFLKDTKFTPPVIMDIDGNVTSTYDVIAYPTSYMIDSEGIIRDVYEGAINYDTMRKATSKMN